MRPPSTKCPHGGAETTLTPRGGPKRSFDECLYIPCTDKGLFTSQPRRGERLFLHRDDDFYTVYKRVLLHPPGHFPATPDSCWPVVRGDIPGTAGWCMRLSSSTDSGRGATNIAFPCHFLEYYVHTSLLLLLFPPAHPLSSLPSSPPQFSFSYVHEHQPQQQWVPAVTRTSKKIKGNRRQYKGPGKISKNNGEVWLTGGSKRTLKKNRERP